MFGSRLQVFAMAFFFLFLEGNRAALAQTVCDAVLKPELAKSSITSISHRQASYSFACSHDFEEFNDTYGGSASAQYLAIGGSGAYNQDNYKKFQHDKCSQASASDHQSNFQYNTLHDASPGAIDAWEKCMRNLSGFNCWATPENKDIGIVLSLNEPGRFWIQDATLSVGSTLHTPKSRIAHNAPLKFGQSAVVVSRPSADIPVSLTVTVETNLKAYACRATVLAVKARTCAEFQTDHPEIAACNEATADGYYWRVGKKLSTYGITMPTAQDSTEVPCDESQVKLRATATTWRFPLTQNRWQTVMKSYVAANNGAGGDPECQHINLDPDPKTPIPQGYHCGTFQVICAKQP